MRPYELPKVTEIDDDAYYVEDKGGVPTRAIKGSDLRASINNKTYTAGENLAINDICVMRSDGKMWKTNSLDSNAIGMIRVSLNSVLANEDGVFTKDGIVSISTSTIGAVQYLSTTGTPTEAIPSSGEIVKILGYGHATGLLLDIDKSWGVVV